jgi:hypothetical protein
MKHKIDVPEGCKVVSVETTDEMVVVKFEKEEPKVREDEPEFKENDIVTCETEGVKWIAIFKEKINCSSFRSKAVYAGSISISDWTSYGEMCSLATDYEKQLLFDKLKEKCLMFDGENVVRWRADPYRKYFYLLGDGDIAETEDNMSNWDNEYYNIGNYFPTKELAEQFQKQYLELLDKFHKNL